MKTVSRKCRPANVRSRAPSSRKVREEPGARGDGRARDSAASPSGAPCRGRLGNGCGQPPERALRCLRILGRKAQGPRPVLVPSCQKVRKPRNRAPSGHRGRGRIRSDRDEDTARIPSPPHHLHLRCGHPRREDDEPGEIHGAGGRRFSGTVRHQDGQAGGRIGETQELLQAVRTVGHVSGKHEPRLRGIDLCPERVTRIDGAGRPVLMARREGDRVIPRPEKGGRQIERCRNRPLGAGGDTAEKRSVDPNVHRRGLGQGGHAGARGDLKPLRLGDLLTRQVERDLSARPLALQEQALLRDREAPQHRAARLCLRLPPAPLPTCRRQPARCRRPAAVRARSRSPSSPRGFRPRARQAGTRPCRARRPDRQERQGRLQPSTTRSRRRPRAAPQWRRAAAPQALPRPAHGALALRAARRWRRPGPERSRAPQDRETRRSRPGCCAPWWRKVRPSGLPPPGSSCPSIRRLHGSGARPPPRSSLREPARRLLPGGGAPRCRSPPPRHRQAEH